MTLPNDPIMLLSVVNLKLRDFYKNLHAKSSGNRMADCGILWARSVRKAPGRGLRIRCPAQPIRVIFPEKAFF